MSSEWLRVAEFNWNKISSIAISQPGSQRSSMKGQKGSQSLENHNSRFFERFPFLFLTG